MDSVTQGLLGATLANLGFRQRIGRDAAWVACGVAILPDLDSLLVPLLSAVGVDLGPLGRAVIHRGHSHSVLLAPLFALLPSLLWWWARRRVRGRERPFLLLYGLLLVALLSQPLLDVFTTYGTQIFQPLTNHRYALDAVPIVDLIYTPLLILTLLACYMLRRLRGEDAARRATMVVGAVGILLTSGYLAAGRAARGAAIERVRGRLGEQPVRRVEAYPLLGAIVLWRVVVERPDGWQAYRVHLLADADAPLRTGRVERKRDPWIARALRTGEARTWGWFTGGVWRAEHRRAGGRHVVELHDLRYSMRPAGLDGLWSLRFEYDGEGRLQEVRMDQHHQRVKMGKAASEMWRELWNP